MTLPLDGFFELASHFVQAVLCKKLLMSARLAPPRAIALSGDSPSFNALDRDTNLHENRFFEAHISYFVQVVLYEKLLMSARHALPRVAARRETLHILMYLIQA